MRLDFNDPVESPKNRYICNHIKSVEIYNGDDSYNATAGIKLSPHGYEGIVMETQDIKGYHTDYRVRGELGIVINIEAEDGEEWRIGVTHHKGSVYVEYLDKCPYTKPEPTKKDFDPSPWLNKTENTLQP